MNKIQQLIEELCPDGVEVKKIQDVCRKITSGGTPLTSRSEYYNGTIPWLRTQEIDWLEIFDTNVKITEEGLKNSSANWIPANCVIVAMYGATAAKVGINKIPLTTNQACCNLEIDYEQANYRYVYYWLCHEYQNLKALGEGAQFNINGQKVKNYEIPIPPLPIQQEIVKILDTFTALDASLKAELEARRKQYEHYRNQLLNFEGKDVEWKTLEQVCLKIENIIWRDIQNLEYQYIDLTSVSRENNAISNTQTINHSNAPSRAKQIVLKDDIIFGTTRPTLRRIAKIPKKYHNQICSTGFCVLRANRETILSKYLFFKLNTANFLSYVENNQEGASYPSISDRKLKQFKIPIPPLSEQERIVSILDKFDALVNIELPAEIEARRKQYEYYREKLLTFEPLVN